LQRKPKQLLFAMTVLPGLYGSLVKTSEMQADQKDLKGEARENR
jgi:hypothetical protein